MATKGMIFNDMFKYDEAPHCRSHEHCGVLPEVISHSAKAEVMRHCRLLPYLLKSMEVL
jgi:hypothetical protein